MVHSVATFLTFCICCSIIERVPWLFNSARKLLREGVKWINVKRIDQPFKQLELWCFQPQYHILTPCAEHVCVHWGWTLHRRSHPDCLWELIMSTSTAPSINGKHPDSSHHYPDTLMVHVIGQTLMGFMLNHILVMVTMAVSYIMPANFHAQNQPLCVNLILGGRG